MSARYLLSLKKSVLFLACGSLISGCSSFGFNSVDDDCNDCSSSSDVKANTALAADNQETNNSPNQKTTLLAANNEAVKQESSQKSPAVVVLASTETSFKGPKALQDIQAISVGVNQGRQNQELTNAATVFIKDDESKPASNSTAIAITEVATQTQAVEVADEPIAEVSVAGVDSIVEESTNSEINSVDQINRLIEDNPTAAGIAAPVVLDVPEVEFKSAAEVIKESQLIDFGIWKIENSQNDKFSGKCQLSTTTFQIDQHDYAAQVWLTVVDDKLLVNSTFDINIKQSGIGIKTDNGVLQRFSGKVYSSNAVWSGNLTKTLKSSNNLKIILGGREFGNKTHEVTVNLKGLKKGYPLYQKCKG